MSKDIRSFFSTVSNKAKTVSEKVKKRSAPAVISSDEEENNFVSKDKKRKIQSPNSNANKTPKSSKLKPISVDDMFSSTPARTNKIDENDIFSDDDFKETLKQLDETELLNKKLPSPKKSPKKIVSNDKPASSSSDKSVSVEDSGRSPSVVKKSKPKLIELDESLTDEDRFYKRQQLYKKYLNRSGPSKPGSKEVPKGKPNCFNGLIFLITGVMESLERDEMAQIITDLGGRVNKSISGKVTHVIVGDDAGPSKTQKAAALGIKMLTEDEFLDLIRIKSNLPVKQKENDEQLVNKSSPHKKQLNASEKRKIESNNEIDVKKLKSNKENKISSKKIDVENEDYEEKSRFFAKSPPESNKTVKSGESMVWVDKYKPKTVKQIIGQQTENSNATKLKKWLLDWFKNQQSEHKRRFFNRNMDSGESFKAALLSGPPGVGKTTTATLVAKELGLDVVEMNASDTRSKKLLQEDVKQLLSNQSLAGFFTGNGGNSATTKNHVLLMDEVDGMAGNEDRGGVQELIQLIKNTSVPIICMCNDRNHPKIRSLANHCFDLRFNRPRVEQIRSAMMSVCFKEGIKIKPDALDQIIKGTQNDLRQTLNNLSMLAAQNGNENVVDNEKAKEKADNSKKDIKLGPWDVVRKVFSYEDHQQMSIHDKSDLFFHDYSLAPLFVQENYLSVIPKANKNEWLDRYANAANYISLGDVIDGRVRRMGAWSLLPMEAMMASVAPGHELSGAFKAQINFPAWLGKNSKYNKFQRLLSQLQVHMRLSISGSVEAVNLDYLKYIRNLILRPLQKANVNEAIDAMQSYHLSREDLDAICELSLWPGEIDPFSKIDSKIKTSFTRAYRKECNLVPYTVISNKVVVDNYDEDGDQINDDDDTDENEDDITKDVMIKAKKTERSTTKSKNEKTEKVKKSSKKK